MKKVHQKVIHETLNQTLYFKIVFLIFSVENHGKLKIKNVFWGWDHQEWDFVVSGLSWGVIPPGDSFYLGGGATIGKNEGFWDAEGAAKIVSALFSKFVNRNTIKSGF